MTRRFDLAPMNTLMLALTVSVLPIPAVLLAAALIPGPQRFGLLAAGGFALFIYASVWIWWRPTDFAVDPASLTIEFPGRALRIERPDIRSARIVAAAELRGRYGLAARVGAGGLWGGFGWLWTSRRGMVDMYISRTDRFVLVERHSGRDLLITPDRAEEFVSALSARA